jgi:hypothetical protein
MKYSFSTSKIVSKLLPVACLSVGLYAAASLPALAADEMYHGNFCVPNQSDINKIDRNQWGVRNTSTSSSAVVQCPFNLPFNANLRIDSVWVTVYDRGPNQDISCTLFGVDLAGTTLWSLTSASSGSSTGHQFLSFDPPNSFTHTINMTCSLPPGVNSGAGASHISTYRLITTP